MNSISTLLKFKFLFVPVFFIFSLSLSAQIVNIPDETLKARLVNYDDPVIDTNGDGEIQVAEAEAFDGPLDLHGYFAGPESDFIYEATGLEAFVNATYLDLSENHIESMDFSPFVNLDSLNLRFNYFNSITLSGLPNLKKANLNTQLNGPSINISNLPNLEVLNLGSCQLEDLNGLSPLSNLKNLDLSQNDFSNSPNIGQADFPSLEVLNLNNASITSFSGISGLTGLKELYAESNIFSDSSFPNLSAMTSLKILDLSNLYLTNIDLTNLSNLSNLEELYFISDQSLTSLNISNLPSLKRLEFTGTQISSLDLSSFNALTNVNGKNNFDLTTLNLSGLSNLETLDLLNDQNITTLDLSDLESMESLSLTGCSLNDIDLSNLTQLTGLGCASNNLTSLDVSTNDNLQTLVVDHNNIPSIDVSNLEGLENFYFDHNPITEIDLSSNHVLVQFGLYALPNLEFANLKNGNNQNLYYYINEYSPYLFQDCPNLQSVCVDDVESFTNVLYNADELGPPDFTVTSDCSDTPAQSNTITGQVNLDQGEGCLASSAVGVPNLMVKTTLGENSYATFTGNDGAYTIYTGEGQSSTAVENNLPAYISISPESQGSDFTGFGNSDEVDFCSNATQTVNDLNVSIVPLDDVVPGFSSSYKIVYENLGTATASGQVTLDFDGEKQVFTEATPMETASSTNSLTFDFSGLQPFHNAEITVEFMNAQPPILNGDDQLDLTAQITPNTNDNTPGDNTFELDQTAVNSYDPNDKQVLEGDEIADEDTGKYLHYIIRFQNTGTANAQNVVVTDTLSDNLDWNSLKMVSASDGYHVKIENGNAVEFSFNGIDLPFEDADEAGSHGYIAYKIKPKNDIQIGDVISGDAEIYFDFNPPILTNNATTTVVDALSVANQELAENIKLYPNPTSGTVNISTGKHTTLKSVSVFSISGRKILQQEASSTLDLGQLSNGVYFVKLLDEEGNRTVKKVVKR